MIDADRAVLGVAATFARAGGEWVPEHFGRFVAARVGVPMLWDHVPVIVSSGRVAQRCGAWRRFAVVDTDLLSGLVVLGECDATAEGLALYDLVAESLRDPYGRGTYGLSIGAGEVVDYGRTAHVLLREVSVTARPADPGAVLLATGPAAVRGYETLSGTPVRR